MRQLFRRGALKRQRRSAGHYGQGGDDRDSTLGARDGRSVDPTLHDAISFLKTPAALQKTPVVNHNVRQSISFRRANDCARARLTLRPLSPLFFPIAPAIAPTSPPPSRGRDMTGRGRI
jgi:hypothetical protein